MLQIELEAVQSPEKSRLLGARQADHLERRIETLQEEGCTLQR